MGTEEETELTPREKESILTELLLGEPEEIALVFVPLFKGVTGMQILSKLKELGIHDEKTQDRIVRHLIRVCSKPKNIEILTNPRFRSEERIKEYVDKYCDLQLKKKYIEIISATR